jgi:hypothetical protein
MASASSEPVRKTLQLESSGSLNLNGQGPKRRKCELTGPGTLLRDVAYDRDEVRSYFRLCRKPRHDLFR